MGSVCGKSRSRGCGPEGVGQRLPWGWATSGLTPGDEREPLQGGPGREPPSEGAARALGSRVGRKEAGLACVQRWRGRVQGLGPQVEGLGHTVPGRSLEGVWILF